MNPGDAYRIKAAELHARAKFETGPGMRSELQSLALAYVRLAEQAERNLHADISYETPPRKDEDPRRP